MAAETHLDFIRDPARAAALLDPLRLRIVAALREPHSAAAVARQLRLPRQRVNYHVRELARAGYLRRAGRRRKRNMIEQDYVATARAYVLAPDLLGALGADPAKIQDRFSAAYLVAISEKAVRDLAELRRRAEEAGQRLATLTLETEVRFATPETRQGFAQELAAQLVRLVAKYHDEQAPGGRRFRFFLGGYPAVSERKPEDAPREEEQ
jgi:DNA-binding transcriptional ArsR family regulator